MRENRIYVITMHLLLLLILYKLQAYFYINFKSQHSHVASIELTEWKIELVLQCVYECKMNTVTKELV